MSTLTMYNFSKRKNSTAAPASAGVDFDVTLKDRTDILNPVFRLALASFPAYNYAQFLGRYYFVTGIESVTADIWDISCSVDVLATYKSAIQNTSAFVMYDTTTNTEIADSRLSTKTTRTISSASASFATLGSGLSAVITLIGKESTTTFITGVSNARYILSSIETAVDNALPDINVGDITDVPEALEVLFNGIMAVGRTIMTTGNAPACVRSAFIVPIDSSSIWGASGDVYLGQFDTGYNWKTIPTTGARVVKDVLTVQIPWQANDWRRNAPYHEVYLYIPYVGFINMPVADLIGETNISIETSLDVASGDAIFRVYTSSGTIAQYNASLAVPLPVGASNVTPMQMLNAGASAIGGLVGGVASGVGGNVGGMLHGGLSGITGFFNNMQPLPSCVGANGGGAVYGLENKVYCYTVFHDTNVSPDSVSAIMGTPARAVKSLSGLSGYVQTVGASVAGLMTDSERDAINNLLNGGVYIE